MRKMLKRKGRDGLGSRVNQKIGDSAVAGRITTTTTTTTSVSLSIQLRG
jgi:hypothetical protein